MRFISLEFLMQRCEEHLDATNTRSTEIESYLVQFLLVRICAEFEIRVTAFGLPKMFPNERSSSEIVRPANRRIYLPAVRYQRHC